MHDGVDVNAVNSGNQSALLLACRSIRKECVKLLLDNGADPNISESATGYRSLHAAVLGNCSYEAVQEIANKAYVDAQALGGETALFLACLRRQNDIAQILLEAAANPNIASATGLTSLHAAVFGGCSQKILRALIKHGADVNATNKNNLTPLMLAYHKGKVEAIHVLVTAGADSNLTDNGGFTVTHHAILGGCDKETLQAIIHHGLDVNATSKDNISPLMLACRQGNVDCVNVLLKAGADPNIQDTNGMTLIYYAVTGGCSKKTLQAIMDHGFDVNPMDKDNKSPLMIACLNGNVDAIHILVNAGADPNIQGTKGTTLIHHAVAGGCNKETLQAIINHGSNVNATAEDCLTPLMFACHEGNVEALNVLLNAGADPNMADSNGGTLIHLSVVRGCSKETLQTIIDHGADVNATDNNNLTTLMLACQKGNDEIINLLFNARADPNIHDTAGETLIHHAFAQGCSKETLQTIIKHGADVNATNKDNITALMLACKHSSEEAINILLDAGADPNIADTDGATWIHHAVAAGCNKKTLQTIIGYGADVNTTNNLTALILACRNENEELINVLLNAGVDPNIKNTTGATLIHHACSGGYSKVTLQTIINHGADVNATNTENVTALMLAC